MQPADRVLELLLILRRDGVLRVITAAAELGVSQSTAHRLMATLRARNFVVQHSDRSYHPGPALEIVTREPSPTAWLAEVARPVLRQLRDEVRETITLIVMTGRNIHVVETVVSPLPLRIGEAPGPIVEPARLTAAGKVLLAELNRNDLERNLPELVSQPLLMQRLLRDLAEVRRRGYGSNYGENTPEIGAVSMPIRRPGGRACAAMSIVVPGERFTATAERRLHGALRAAVSSVENQL